MFPKQSEIYIPLLKELIRRGGSSKPSERDENGQTIAEVLADSFNLSEEARNFEYEDSYYKNMRNKWYNNVQWARNALVKQGMISNKQTGVWIITEEGRKWVQQFEKEKIVKKKSQGVNIRPLINHNPYFPLTEELPDDSETKNLYEGAKQIIIVNRYERNNKARQQCIEYYGTKCYVCEFDFEKAFGELGKGFIHVHHLTPLSEINQKYQINPIEDLRPVCPNCHAMIHKKNPPFNIEEVKTILNNNFQHKAR